MLGKPVHFENPADDISKGRHFWGSLFGLFDLFAVDDGGFDIEVSVIGSDRHLEVMQEALEPGQAEGVWPWHAVRCAGLSPVRHCAPG